MSTATQPLATSSDALYSALLQAMSLSERRCHVVRRGGSSVNSSSAIHADNPRLRKWLAQVPFDTPAILASRLESENLSLEEFTEIVALDMEEVASSIDQPPAWIASLHRVFSAENDETEAWSVPLAGNAKDALVVVLPLLSQAATSFLSRLKLLCGDWRDCPLHPDKLAEHLLDDLETQVANLLVRTVVLELNVARLQNELAGETPEERYQSFLQRLGTPAGRLRLFAEYPVLLRSVQQTIDHWIEAMMEILTRLREDWSALQSTFLTSDAGTLEEVKVGAGDRHRRGRTVAILRFSNGAHLVYKPHSLRVDEHFQQFLAWMNERGLAMPLRAPSVLSRSEYGWTEYCQPATCESVDGIRRFYRRLGLSLAVLYALGATDFHFENLLACGEYPILIDLEALFHPQLPTEEQRAVKTFLQEAVFSSISRTGLLPWRAWQSGDHGGVDVSGIGGRGGQLAPNPVLVSEAARTDSMKFVRRQVTMAERHNQPTLQGEPINPRDYEAELAEGFSEGYKLFLNNRSELLAVDGPLEAFRNDAVRAIAQQTRIYSDLLRDSYHPNVLRNGLDRDRLLDRLWATTVTSPHRRLLVPFELEDLRAGDVPLFSTTPGSRSLWSSRNVEIPDFLERSSFERVLDTIHGLSTIDLDNQLLILHSAYATLADSIPSQPVSSRDTQANLAVSRPEALEANFQSALQHLAQRLTSRAFRRDGFVVWTALQPGVHAWEVGPTGYDLYGGLAGIGLSLGYIAEVLADESVRTLAGDCLSTALSIVDSEKDLGRFRSQSIGAFSGRSGLLYAAHQLALLWNDDALLERSVELAKDIAESGSTNEKLEIASGAAGALIVLSNLYRTTSDAAVRSAAEIFAQKLLGNVVTEEGRTVLRSPQSEPLPIGFAHGSAGIAYALYIYGNVTENQEIAALGRRLFFSNEDALLETGLSTVAAVEHALQLPHDSNLSTVSWCHGGVGRAMARLRLQTPRTPSADTAVDEEIKRLLAVGTSGSSCLCHGDAGNAQLLVDLAYRGADPGKKSKLLREAQGLLMPFGNAAWRFPTPNGVETPGLMLGLAGFAHGLLRATSALQLPSILMLDSLDSLQ